MEKNSLYTEEVMNHFFKPKNRGEIKNADAVGELGNPSCLLPEDHIWLNNELTQITHASKNQRVISHEAKNEKILRMSSRIYSGEIVILKNCLGSIELTPEHLIYAIKIPEEVKYLRNKYKRKLSPAWYHADQLRRRDIVLYPLLKQQTNICLLEVNIPKLKFDYRSKEIPNKVPISSELLRLFGYFLAEGSINEKITRVCVSFALHIKEKDIAEDIRKITRKLFNLKVNITEKPQNSGQVVTINSVKVARWFKNLFGNGAKNKKIPHLLMCLPPKKQRDLIYGLWKGDGYINLDRINPRAGYSTISYNLAQQMKILLLRQNIIPSYYVEKEKTVRGVKHQQSYRIHVGQRESLTKLSAILKLIYIPKSYSSIDSWLDNKYLYTPITGIGQRDYSGKVYNLEVANAHSFLSDAFTIHNCGDVMKVYLKVDKKSNKIKDIKFQTMGCAAAIATSSMITELAKGKTIEQAKKISNKDIADKLGGLPKIKMHCSNLAVDTLRKAIEDFEKHK